MHPQTNPISNANLSPWLPSISKDTLWVFTDWEIMLFIGKPKGRSRMTPSEFSLIFQWVKIAFLPTIRAKMPFSPIFWKSGQKMTFSNCSWCKYLTFYLIFWWEIVRENRWEKMLRWKWTDEFEGVVFFDKSIVCPCSVRRNVAILYWFKWFY